MYLLDLNLLNIKSEALVQGCSKSSFITYTDTKESTKVKKYQISICLIHVPHWYMSPARKKKLIDIIHAHFWRNLKPLNKWFPA